MSIRTYEEIERETFAELVAALPAYCDLCERLGSWCDQHRPIARFFAEKCVTEMYGPPIDEEGRLS
jgi:hypothetical protein